MSIPGTRDFHHGLIGDVPRGEVGQRGLAEIRDDGHPGPARAGPALLDGYGHQRRFPALQLPTPAQTRLWSAHLRVVDFDLPVQGFPGGVDHGSPELVQDPPGRLIPTDAQLVLKQQRPRSPACRSSSNTRPKTTSSAGSSSGGRRCPLSATPGSDTLRIPAAATRPAGRPGRGPQRGQ